MTGFSAVILAGGKSSRMKTDKAELELSGKSFVQFLTDRLISLGMTDIMISGYKGSVSRTRYIPDIYPGKGPLSGIHAGLYAALGQKVLFVPVDAPLIPVACIGQLLSSHTNGITAAVCGDRLQPLTAVFDKELYAECDAFIRTGRLKVSELMEKTGCKKVIFDGDELLIRGCNTPEEYWRLREFIKT